MNFTFTDDQADFGLVVRDVLAGCRDDRGAAAWQRLGTLGFFGMLVDDSRGGLGLRLADALPALEETGRAAMPGPVVDTAVAGALLLDGPELDKLAAGALRVAVADSASTAADADLADVIVAWPRVASRDAVSSQAPQLRVRLEPRPGIDPARPLFTVTLDGDTRELTGSAVTAWRAATVATAAQLIGAARHLLDTTVAYARERTQFGRAIGGFQAVKHRLADVAIAVEFAAPLVHRAALSYELPSGERDVSAAKAAANDAARLAAEAALQVHGAIGYTHELELRHWLTRVWSWSAAYGTSATHRARVRALVREVPRWP
ncbi:acyl-CoA dehydrogenase [Nonomuraea soli]|uniref:Alkylation response protein AidB-like acyl-CoA dehydrogenase n=1 Tax=Nonomuraea soli TaxID=1032476 RepID=A0A7W0HMG8_9ACTN|nr:acyl-CoA dehydrogenase [Nonomuraea soli]MBA2888728.1 alkylation response protein AidB-like acyl-CoA dehydrogenase [Nonomuraea soli]